MCSFTYKDLTNTCSAGIRCEGPACSIHGGTVCSSLSGTCRLGAGRNAKQIIAQVIVDNSRCCQERVCGGGAGADPRAFLGTWPVDGYVMGVHAELGRGTAASAKALWWEEAWPVGGTGRQSSGWPGAWWAGPAVPSSHRKGPGL